MIDIPNKFTFSQLCMSVSDMVRIHESHIDYYSIQKHGYSFTRFSENATTF